MAVAAFVLSLCALIVSLGAMVAAIMSVRFARLSANAASRSAELAEIVERGRRYGWRIEARTSDKPRRFYTLRNVGTVNARDVSLTGDYKELAFVDGQSSVDVARVRPGCSRRCSPATTNQVKYTSAGRRTCPTPSR